jgi:hypothetical protein
MWDGRSRPREALQCLLERGDRLLWIKQRIRGGCIRSIQHSVLTTDGVGGESPAPFGFTVCLELNFATAGFSSVISHYREGRLNRVRRATEALQEQFRICASLALLHTTFSLQA